MRLLVVALLLSALCSLRPVAAQSSLVALSELYAAADYAAALQVLDGLEWNRLAEHEAVAAARYRLLCLLALGRSDDARTAAHALVERAPFAKLTDEDASPSVRSKFAEWRLQALPRAARERFADGKAAFGSNDYAAARQSFTEAQQLLRELNASEESDDSHKDMALLASSFLELITAAASSRRQEPASEATPGGSVSVAPPPTPPPAAAVAAGPPTPSPVPSVPKPDQAQTRVDRARVYTTADPGVVAAQPISQDVPAWPAQLPRTAALGRSMILEILIGIDGSVESVQVRRGVHPVYDTLVARAARAWQYEPAVIDGRPVRFVRAMELRLLER